MSRFSALGLAVLLAFNVSVEAATPVRVTASFAVLADLAREVGGERVSVRSIVGPGMQPHGHRFTPSDVRALRDADLALMNGLGFDEWFRRLVEAASTSPELVELAAGAELIASAGHAETVDAAHGHGHGHGAAKGHEVNPHAWLSIANAQHYVTNIADALCRVDVAGCDVYRARATRYRSRLAALHHEMVDMLAAVPPARRTIVVSHRALDYFTRSVSIRVLALSELGPLRRPSAAAVAKLIVQMREQQAAALFLDVGADRRLFTQIAKEAQATLGGRLYVDTLSAPSGPAASYEQMMRHNAKTLAEALGASR